MLNPHTAVHHIAQISTKISLRAATYAIFWAFLCVTTACSNQYAKSPEQNIDLPSHWQSHVGDFHDNLRWSDIIQAETLTPLIQHTLKHNQALAQKALDVDIANASLYESKMQFLPKLDTYFTTTRRSVVNNENVSSINNTLSLGIDFDYELDLWGKLNDQKKSAMYTLAATQADYQQTLRTTISQVAESWASVIENEQLVGLRNTRLESLKKNLAIIESGYKSGLNQALEVYLARNDVENERSQLIQSEQLLSDARRSLSLLLGQYPHNNLPSLGDFPNNKLVLPPKIPSEILMRRPDLQAAWFRILAQNANLAVAHKSRYPSLSLTGSAGYSSDALSSLLDGPLGWSFAGSLLQPLLKAGTLKATETIQQATLAQTEHAYTAAVYSAFREVESGLEKQRTLEQQFSATERSRDNALQAEKLSFEQYLKGIVSYTTVLDAQRRAVDSEIQLISLNKQIFVNRVTLHEALAGQLDFDDKATQEL